MHGKETAATGANPDGQSESKTHTNTNTGNGHDRQDVRPIACDYIARGWTVIPIPAKRKKPAFENWQDLRITLADVPKYFLPTSNVGVRLGPTSGHLSDVDLDFEIAVRLAPRFLPATGAIFGRASKRRSHYPYIIADAALLKHNRVTYKNETGALLFELRLGTTKGLQTVFPGSVHPSGEHIEWDTTGDIATSGIADMLTANLHLAVACILVPHWPNVGARHEAAQCLGGVLARAGWDVDHIAYLVEVIAQEAGDSETADRIKAAVDSCNNLANGVATFGIPKAKEIFGADVVKHLATLLDVEEITQVEHVCVADVEEKPINWLWPYRLARGKLNLIAGLPGENKSTLTLWLAAMVTTGGAYPNSEGNAPIGNAILLTAEDDIADTIRPRLEVAGADLTKVHVVRGIKVKHNGRDVQRSFDLMHDIERLEEMIKTVADVALIIIDPLSAYMGRPGKLDLFRSTDVRGTLKPLSDMAARCNVAVVGVTHLNKNTQGKALARVLDSSAYVAAPRSVYFVARDPDHNELRLLLCGKNNLAPNRPGLAFKIVERLTKSRFSACPAIEWERVTVTVTADEVFSRKEDGRKSDRLEEAKALLKSMLAKGPLLRRLIEEAAQDRDISDKTLRRAKEVLGVKSTKDGHQGPWKWSLPEEEPF